ncbi:WSC domain-containing protein 1-like [Mercenaria mercenaria]|uniref:WSC domain-containing protein 1-like n=1 Tax=Mercenaria mercenaria TaxID=6596 RepID=UPI00234EED34|nr:WSC domain-containing protein 1-like [Mercenaria mercenaria]
MILEILFTLLKCVLVTKAYCVSDKPTTWMQARKTHTLATPDIHYNGQNLSVNLDFELDNKTVWIGYIKALTAFEYFGCMREETGSSLKSFKLRKNRPGLCFSACGKQVLVGLRGRMCYCFENETIVNYRLSYCDTACEADDGFLCGGAKHVSLYKVNKEGITFM